MRDAEALAPDASNAHMFVGDAYRAQKNLEKAREEYLRGHELEPRNAVLLVKAGHANTFLGDYAAARADYDSAIDRKSTRLNSSHSQISYAVFCLKKKKNKIRHRRSRNALNSHDERYD